MIPLLLGAACTAGACRPSTSAAPSGPPSAASVPTGTEPGAASPPGAAGARRLVWRALRPQLLAVDGGEAIHWEGPDQNVLVSTDLRTEAITRREPLLDAPYIGQPQGLLSLGGVWVGHWQQVAGVEHAGEQWKTTWRSADSWSSWLPTGRGLVVANQRQIALLDPATGAIRWRTPLPAGAQPPELTAAGEAIGAVWQHYDPNAPTPKLLVPHRVASFELGTGKQRWQRDSSRLLPGGAASVGSLAVWRDRIFFTEDADLVFVDGPSGRELGRAKNLGSPVIYPHFAIDDQQLAVALDDRIGLYDHQGQLLTMLTARGVRTGSRIERRGDELYATARGPSLLHVRADGSDTWRVGTGVDALKLWITERAVVADSHGAVAALPRPIRVVLERATLRGSVRLAGHAAANVTVTVQGEAVPLAADGTFTAQIEEAGYVTVAAEDSLAIGGERLLCPSATSVVALDGSGSYRVELALCSS